MAELAGAGLTNAEIAGRRGCGLDTVSARQLPLSWLVCPPSEFAASETAG